MLKLKKISRSVPKKMIRRISGRFAANLTDRSGHSGNFTEKPVRIYNKLSGVTEAVEDRFGDAKKHAAMAGVAVVATASLLTAGLFGSPADLARNEVPDRAFTPAYEQVIIEEEEEEPPDPDDTEPSGDGSSTSAAQENVRSIPERLRTEILRLPLWVRSLVGLPLWCAGRFIYQAGEFLWGSALTPFLCAAAGWIFTLLLVLAVVAATVKAILPDVPIRKILCKKTVLTVAIALALLAAADTVGRIFSPDYEKISGMVRFCLPVVIAAGITFRFLRKRKSTSGMP